MGSRKIIMIVLAVVLMSWTTTQAQGPGTCIQALMPCQAYLSSKNPPATCCDPLKKAVETDLACLCAAFNNPALAATFNVTQAMQLPLNCGIKNAGPSLCTDGGSSSPTSSPGASAPLGSTPSTKPPSSGAGRSIVLAGPVSSVMLLLTGFMFY